MEPEIPTSAAGVRLDSSSPAANNSSVPESPSPSSERPHPDTLAWLFIGDHGLRAGTSVVIFAALLYFFVYLFGTILGFVVEEALHLNLSSRSAGAMVLGELPWVAALLAAGTIVALFEGRRLTDFNLNGPRSLARFFSGLITGFLALSALVIVLAWGGWLHIGPVALSGIAIAKYGAAWALCFLLVGLTEEGTFRCYLQFTFTRGINFGWALATVGSLCLYLVMTAKGHGVWGIYAFALLGLVPCLWLHLTKVPGGGFWYAAWASSTAFGFVHTFNDGENWIGIFAAAAIGFVFCVSVRVTGSAWWAIGCHSAWDWAETYFYGTADSGFLAPGHYLSARPSGNVLLSGGSDGPEGSLLVVPIILLLLLTVLAIYGRRKTAVEDSVAPTPKMV